MYISEIRVMHITIIEQLVMVGPTKKRPEQPDTAWSSPTQPGAARQELCTGEQPDTIIFKQSKYSEVL